MTRGKPLSFDRDEVLEKAMNLLWKKGYQNTSMTELLDHMGIQRQSFYNTFGNKEQLFLEAVSFYTNTTMNEITTVLDAPGNPLENIRKVLAMWQEMMVGEEACGCMLGNSIAEFGLNHPKISELLKYKFSRLEKALRKVFERAVADGLLPETKDPAALSRTIIAMVQGTALLSRLGYGEEMFADVAKSAEELIFA